MKKIVLVLFLFTLVYASEAKTLKILSGSTKFFTEQEEKFTISINWESALIRKKSVTMEEFFKSKGEKDYADWLEGVKYSNGSFCRYFNEKKSKKTLISATNEGNEEPRYTMKVEISEMDLGYNTGVIFGLTKKSGGMRLYGKATIIDNKTGEKMVVFNMVKVKSMGIPSIKGRMIMACHYLAEGLIDEI